MNDPAYIRGDPWRICEVCGFKTRSSQTSKRWDGLIVCREDFEPRHPQDLVRGRKDDQNVPDPRPEPLDTVIGPLTTTISSAASAGATTISVASSVRFMATDRIGVGLNDGNFERNTVHSVPDGTSVILLEPLGGPVSIGNVVIDYSAVSHPDIG